MTNDSQMFRTHEELTAAGWRLEGNIFVRNGERYLPLYESKLFGQYDHRFATFDGVSEDARRKNNARNMTPGEKADSRTMIIPRYWIPEEEVAKRLDKQEEGDITILRQAGRQAGSSTHRQSHRLSDDNRHHSTTLRTGGTPQHSYNQRMGVGVETHHERDQRTDSHGSHYPDSGTWPQRSSDRYPSWLTPIRRITNATNERTTIASFVPRAGMSDSAPLLRLPASHYSALMIASLNSIVLDFAARTAVGGSNLSHFIIKQLPVLQPQIFLEDSTAGPPWRELIIPRVLRLTYTAEEMKPFALQLGYDGPPFPLGRGTAPSLEE